MLDALKNPHPSPLPRRGNKNTYDVNLHSVDYRSPAAHIKIK